jgi:uncharacterized protein YfaS (alpha-2-macroglobulin family)
MKHLLSTITLLVILFSSSMAQQQPKPFNYSEKWKQVEKQRNNGMPKEALKLVAEIYKQAKLDQQHGHFLRAIIYQIGLTSTYEENSTEKAIEKIDAEIKGTSEPQTQILHSAKAEILWNYYEQNRYMFMNRTATVNYKKEDLATWDLRSIVEAVFKEYQLSLKNEKLLKQTNLAKYDQILSKTDNGRPYRPTLYDFLAHRAIDFFMGEEPSIVKPAVTFYINNSQYISNSNTFSTLKLTTPDSLSMKFFALQLLQQVIQFHLNDADPAALIDADLKRLDFVRQNGLFESIDSLYLNSLISIYQKHQQHPESAAICYKIGQFYNTSASKYDSLTNPSVQFDEINALKYIDLAIEKYPNTIGANNCKYLKNQITYPQLSTSLENYSVPNQPFRVLVNYKNSPKVYVRILPFDVDDYKKFRSELSSDKLLSKLATMPYTSQTEYGLPGEKDYQYRKTEIKINALKKGYYLILTSNSPTFNVSKDQLSYADFFVSDLSYIERTLNSGGSEIAVSNRLTGKPIANAVVEAKFQTYNYTLRKYEWNLLKKGNTDQDGHFVIPPVSARENSRNIEFSISYNKDVIYSTNYLYQYYRDTTERTSIQTYFFTDRAIYRPGQTIYFKGIMVEYTGKNSKILTGTTSKVDLYDANWQEKSTLNLTTNEFGSFQGSFVAPTGGLNGQMQVRDPHGAVYFRVEDYKRPKFETTFNPIKGSYRLNDKVTVTGVAKAYSGNTLDGAKVKYRVTRRASYPWWRWGWGYQPTTTAMEILSGETVTNEKGEYTIVFDAIPDFNSKKQFLPIFNYTVSVDVSDINGETHPATTSVSVGYVSMYASVSLPSVINMVDTGSKYDIRTTNLNYQLEPASISVKVSRLEQPSEIYNTKYWQKPTSYMYSKEEFSKYFPYEEYQDELNINNWKKLEITYNKTHNTATDTVLTFADIRNWKTGNYIIEISGKDNFGVAFEKSQNFTVINSDILENSTYSHLEARANEYSTEPGKTVKITIESRHTNAQVYVEVMKEDLVLQKQWITLDKNAKTFDLPITEKDYGNLRVNVVLTINNRSYSNPIDLQVKKKNDYLVAKFATFRDKLEPGQNEEWRITIKGSDGEKVASELLATMYDASLDAFVKHYWSFYLNSHDSYSPYWNINTINSGDNAYTYYYNPSKIYLKQIEYEDLNMQGFYFTRYYGRNGSIKYKRATRVSTVSGGDIDLLEGYAESAASYEAVDEKNLEQPASGETTVTKAVAGAKQSGKKDESGGLVTDGDREQDGRNEVGSSSPPIQVRSNFNETAFFMPQMATDAEGNVVLKFKVPESLTRWNIMGLAHTKDLRTGQFNKELVTQKSLMVVPNPPRFFREGDKMEFAVKISNISESDLNGIAKIEFLDAITLKPINSELGLTNLEIPFSALKGQSTSVAWKIAIPQGIMAITYRVTAQAGNFSDGEEMTLPVLTNRMLVTESLPLPINGNQTKTFSFDKLKNNTSTTLKNFKYTLEFTSNPAWYAIQALPYLMEYPYECSEQTFSRFYANSIATHIANSSPKIKAVFESWKINSPEALMSNLEKNQELKSLLLEETPWVMDAKSESDQKKRVGLLFDLINMSNQLDAALEKLTKMQTSNGGWPWFAGMPDNEYITQYIVTGFGHLKNLGITDIKSNPKTWAMVAKAVRYTDDRIRENYEDLIKWKVDMSKDHISWTEIQYLYARTFFWKDVEIASKNKEAVNYFLNQSKKYWLTKGIYLQGMMALANERSGDDAMAKKIMASVKDNALYSEEMGMYWRNEGFGYYWYEAPIERQALLIEAFDGVNNDLESVEKMKIWLLKQKQTQSWSTTKSTAEACYALLLKGTNQLTDDQLVEIKIGDKVIDPKKMDNVKVEAGTGYFKTAWNGTEITPEMGNITVTKSTAGVAWGSVYWQYFENLDKITPAATPLSMKKELFVVRITPTGEVIEPITSGAKIKVGDKIKVRIVLRSDRDMEYVHMKDMRASAFEPINVLSNYKYQDGLGYYESTRDAATNFFFDYLRKGTYVFEYTMFATQKGDFSNGITTIQCMYAPEFTSHSEGIRVTVE